MNDLEHLAGESEWTRAAASGPEKRYFRQKQYLKSKLHLLPPKQEVHLRLALSGLSSRQIAEKLEVRCHRSIRKSIKSAIQTIRGME